MPDIEGGFAPSSMNFNADATAIGCSLAHSSASPSSGRSRLCLSEPSCSSFWLSCYSEALAGSEAALSTELATTVAAGSASYSLSCWSWFCSEGFKLLLSHRPIGRTLGVVYYPAPRRRSLTKMSQRRFHSARLVGQHDAQQRTMDFEMPVVIDEPCFAKLVHEMTDP